MTTFAGTYSYDPFNRLIGVQWNGVSQASYGYNGKGQRISKTAGGLSSAYLWDGANLAQENRGGTYYLYSTLGMLSIALTSGGSSQVLEMDLVGTVLGVVNTSVMQNQPTAKGEVVGTAGSRPPVLLQHQSAIGAPLKESDRVESERKPATVGLQQFLQGSDLLRQ